MSLSETSSWQHQHLRTTNNIVRFGTKKTITWAQTGCKGCCSVWTHQRFIVFVVHADWFCALEGWVLVFPSWTSSGLLLKFLQPFEVIVKGCYPILLPKISYSSRTLFLLPCYVLLLVLPPMPCLGVVLQHSNFQHTRQEQP